MPRDLLPWLVLASVASHPAVSNPVRRREREGVLLCALSAASYAGTTVLVSYDAGATVSSALAVRFVVAAALLWLIVARLGAVRLPSRRDTLAALALGTTLYSVQTGLVYESLARIDASLVELLVYTYPAMVVIGAIALRRERPSLRRFVALALASAGIVLVLLGASAGALEPAGSLMALCAAAIYAVYVLVGQPLGERMHPLMLTALVCTGTAFAVSLVGGARGTIDLGMPLGGWLWSVVIAVLAVGAIGGFLAGMARVGPSRASILGTLEPPIALLLAFLMFGERLTLVQLFGGALVVLGVIVLQARSLRSRDRGASALASAPAAARPLADEPARGRGLGVRAQVGWLSRARLRRRERDRDPVARR
jgi:drug/metabolite transporter (DMT)-like permease